MRSQVYGLILDGNHIGEHDPRRVVEFERPDHHLLPAQQRAQLDRDRGVDGGALRLGVGDERE